jgi:hypothetical protein
MALSVVPILGGVNSTIVAGSTGAAPAANTLIVDSGILPAGDGNPVTYMVSVITGQSGTPDANLTNVLVNINTVNTTPVTGGTTIGTLTSFPATQSGGTAQRFKVTLSAGQRILICVGNTAGGASSIYNAGMTITRCSDAYAVI